MIVVDASVAVKWFVKEEGHEAALGLLTNAHLSAPDLVFPETANVLWKKLRRGEVTQEQTEKACRSLPNFFRTVVPSAILISDALAMARKLDHAVYDCTYLACAEGLGTKLVTADASFRSKLRHGGLGHLAASLDEADAFSPLKESLNLTISELELDRLLDLSKQFEQTLSAVEALVGRPTTPGGVRWVDTADLRPAFDSPARLNLEAAISKLARDNIADIVALAWLGRGFDGDDWIQLRNHADAMLGENPTQHLRYVASLLVYSASGIEKLNRLRAASPQIAPGSTSEK